jgi:hypothetical protein
MIDNQTVKKIKLKDLLTFFSCVYITRYYMIHMIVKSVTSHSLTKN